jgi:hypothetical protein
MRIDQDVAGHKHAAGLRRVMVHLQTAACGLHRPNRHAPMACSTHAMATAVASTSTATLRRRRSIESTNNPLLSLL